MGSSERDNNNSMKLCYLVLSVLAIIQENILPTSGHCCHPCIHKGPLRSCSVECSGKLIDDGRCGSDDFYCSKTQNDCNVFGCSCKSNCEEYIDCDFLQAPSNKNKTGYSYAWINGEEYSHSLIEAAIRFHRIDANQDGYICCNETFEWNKSAFREAAKEGLAMILETMPGNHDPHENPCFKLEKHKEKFWPSYLKPLLREIGVDDGKIIPDEFDGELYQIDKTKLTKLMKDVQEHPIVWTKQ